MMKVIGIALIALSLSADLANSEDATTFTISGAVLSERDFAILARQYEVCKPQGSDATTPACRFFMNGYVYGQHRAKMEIASGTILVRGRNPGAALLGRPVGARGGGVMLNQGPNIRMEVK